MPQLDTTWFLSQMFWLVVCFSFMLLIMSKLILPLIRDIMEKRQNRIDDYLAKAQENKALAEQSLEKYNQKLAEALAKTEAAKEDMLKELDLQVAQKQEDLAKKLDAQLAESVAKIDALRKQAEIKMVEMAEDTAHAVLQKLDLQKVDEKDLRDVINGLVKSESGL